MHTKKTSFFKKGRKKKNTSYHHFHHHHEGGTKKNNTARKKKEKKKAPRVVMAEAVVDVERLKLGPPTAIWNGLVLHHKDVFVSHVLSKLNETDRWFFSRVNGESWGVLEYAGAVSYTHLTLPTILRV